MKRKCITRVLAVSVMMSLSVSSLAFAGDWKKNDIGWWWENEDGSYPISRWEWLDGNQDGIAECYYFGDQGYMLENTTIGEFTVNADGAWTVDGVVQVKAVAHNDGQEGEQSSNVQKQDKQSPNEGNYIQQDTDEIEVGEEDNTSLREKLEEIQEELYEVEYASKEKRQEVLYRYLGLLGIDTSGLTIEDNRISYFAFGDTRSSRFFNYPDVLTSILVYMGERKEGIDTIYVNEGIYPYPAYLLMKTREAANAIKDME